MPGLDGFRISSFRVLWEDLYEDIMAYIDDFIFYFLFLWSTIFQSKKAEKVFGPTNLISSGYKIVAMVLSSRSKQVLDLNHFFRPRSVCQWEVDSQRCLGG